MRSPGFAVQEPTVIVGSPVADTVVMPVANIGVNIINAMRTHKNFFIFFTS